MQVLFKKNKCKKFTGLTALTHTHTHTHIHPAEPDHEQVTNVAVLTEHRSSEGQVMIQ